MKFRPLHDRVVVKRIDAEDLKPTAVIATAFGCPFEGKVPMERTLELAEQFAEGRRLEEEIRANLNALGFGR